MLIITHRIKSPSEFMDRYLPDGVAGGFFLDQKLGMSEGTKFCLELTLSWLQETYFAYARVERMSVEWNNCGRIQTGAIVRLLAQDAPLRVELLQRVQASTETVRQRGADRSDTSLQAHYFDQRRRARRGAVLDLSPSGAYVEAPRPLPTGTDLHLRFEDQTRGVMRHVRGKVVRLDFSREVAGMGIEFQFTSRRERKAMTRLCNHLAPSQP